MCRRRSSVEWVHFGGPNLSSQQLYYYSQHQYISRCKAGYDNSGCWAIVYRSDSGRNGHGDDDLDRTELHDYNSSEHGLALKQGQLTAGYGIELTGSTISSFGFLFRREPHNSAGNSGPLL